MSELLRVENFHVAVGGKTLLHGINLTVNTGEVHVIMGVNGAGKSTLLHAIMGNPAYEITEGHVYFEGEDITELSTDKRARLGIFLSFQNPVSIAGITTENFIRTAKTTISGKQQRLFPFKRLLKSRMEGLAMDPSCGDRYLNDGFSGGERKKSEILQMRILEPKLAMLDETDSGLDVDAVRIVSRNIGRPGRHVERLINTERLKTLSQHPCGLFLFRGNLPDNVLRQSPIRFVRKFHLILDLSLIHI